MNDIIPIKNLEEAANKFALESISESTRKSYQKDWENFSAFCRSRQLEPYPASPETVALYITELAIVGMSVATINRRCTSISAIHRAGDKPVPTKSDCVYRVMQGIRRKKTKPRRRPKAISWSQLRDMINCCGLTMMGMRDAALLAIGWAAALRRSEICNLRIEDIDIDKRGALLQIRHSKTDQTWSGKTIAIPRSGEIVCPVGLIERWINRMSEAEGVKPEHLDRSKILIPAIGSEHRGCWHCPVHKKPMQHSMVSRIVKKYCQYIGLNPENYSSHSLRRGFATESGAKGVPERIISRHTRHKSIQVLREYIEDGSIWIENPLNFIYGSANRKPRQPPDC